MKSQLVFKYFLKIVSLIIIVAGITLITESANSHSRTKEDYGIKFENNLAPAGYQDTAYLNKGRQLLEQFSNAFEAAASKISPSVVPIFAEQLMSVQNPFGSPDDPFKDFFGEDFFKKFLGGENMKQTVRSLGSGVIVTPDGYILTNNHVVQGASKLTVELNDKKKYNAQIIGTDPQTDVAIIKINADNLTAATLTNSDNVKVGQWAVAVGNPFQLMHTVTAGIISAKGRSSVGLADYEDFIQTDAAINPGNSGGALADLDGRVIGINTAISSPSGGNVGIGFAIPINMAKKVMEELIKHGKIARGYIALYPQDITNELAKALNLKTTEGVLVGDVVKNGPADKAGIKTGDIIEKFNDNKVENSVQLRNMVAVTKPDTDVPVLVLRNDKEIELKVRILQRPVKNGGNNIESTPEESFSSEKLGFSIQNLSPDVAASLGYDNQEGVIVANVEPGSAAEDAGIQKNDLIKEVNRNSIKSAKEFEDIISHLKKGDTAAFLVQRQGSSFYVAIELQD